MLSQQATDAIGFRANEAFEWFIDGMIGAHMFGKCWRSIKLNGANFTKQQLFVVGFIVYGILRNFIAFTVMSCGLITIFSLFVE